MGHEVYEIWRTIGAQGISPDGRWVHYILNVENADGTLVVREVDSGREHRFERGGAPSFAGDSRYLVFTLRPARAEEGGGATGGAGGAARGGGGAGSQGRAPARDTLALLDLQSGEVERIAGLRSRSLSDDGRLLAWHLHGEEGNSGPLVVRDLVSGARWGVEAVTSFALAPGGQRVAWVAEGEEEGEAIVGTLSLTGGELLELYRGIGSASRLTLDGSGRQVAFLFQGRGEGGAALPHALYHWRAGAAGPASRVAGEGTPGIPPGWRVSGDRDPVFSRSGARLVFGTTPRPLSPRSYADAGGVEAAVRVEVWHWQDPQLMSVQNVRLQQEQRRSFAAVVHLDRGGRVTQLATEEVADVTIPGGWDGAFGLGSDSRPYAIRSSWETPPRRDIYRVDPLTGTASLLLSNLRSTPAVSPGGRWLTWWDGEDRSWWGLDLRTGSRIALSSGIPFPVHNERDDTPAPPGSYGSAGWTEGDGRFLVYDRFDLWAVDPASPATPVNVTRGEGRASGIRFRVIRPEREEDGSLATDTPLLLSAFQERTKQAGFYRGRLDGRTAPERLVFEDRSFSTPVRAAGADRWLFTRETFREFPDLWVADGDFSSPVRVSDANPQQAEYRWGDAELVEWLSQDGIPLQGILLKPDDFDPARRYPMIVYFYERMSDGLHSHYAPVPHRSRIAFPMYTSRDYLVFIPDIVYRIGFPGESALNAIIPGVMHLVNRGFVDPERMALQGHSWGGYQIAYMVTRTGTLFRAAAPGAPVANMTSAYGGIRRETGLVRNFNYESTQSRIGQSLWEAPLRYVENSPLFWLDKVETPLLIMHNDRDGHVPWEQGVELFTALRRLGKPAWLINYTGEPHWPTSFANRRDWNIRMQQFFDHYLKDAPPPAWMAEGIPAVRRTETLGLELVQPPVAAAETNGGGR